MPAVTLLGGAPSSTMGIAVGLGDKALPVEAAAVKRRQSKRRQSKRRQ